MAQTNSQLPNVIVFGSTGSGKSSIINMLSNIPGCEEPPAIVSSNATSTTFESKAYQKLIGETHIVVHDTAGLDVPDPRTSQQVVGALYHLTRALSQVNLLLFVLKAPRITDNARRNYDFFYHGLCRSCVPIVIVITGLENENDIDEWWKTNCTSFTQFGMEFKSHTCITTILGPRLKDGHVYQQTYDDSTTKLNDLILDNINATGWRPPGGRIGWLKAILPSFLTSRNALALDTLLFSEKKKIKNLYVLYFHRKETDAAAGQPLWRRLTRKPHSQPTSSRPSPVSSEESLPSYHTHQHIPLIFDAGDAEEVILEENRSIVFFGQRRTGKTSIIDMLDNNPSSKTPQSKHSIGSHSTHCIKLIDHEIFNVFEMVADDSGGMSNTIQGLDHLLRNVQAGIYLLVLVIQEPAASGTRPAWISHQLLKLVSGDAVPLVLLVTGLENNLTWEEENPFDKWWEENESRFTHHGKIFDGQAPITTLQSGSQGGAYQRSKRKVEELLSREVAVLSPEWESEAKEARAKKANRALCTLLQKSWGIDKSEAKQLAEKVGKQGLKMRLKLAWS